MIGSVTNAEPNQLTLVLAAHGCELLREGSRHTIWRNPSADLRAPVPRHRLDVEELRRSSVCAPAGSRMHRRPHLSGMVGGA